MRLHRNPHYRVIGKMNRKWWPFCRKPDNAGHNMFLSTTWLRLKQNEINNARLYHNAYQHLTCRSYAKKIMWDIRKYCPIFIWLLCLYIILPLFLSTHKTWRFTLFSKQRWSGLATQHRENHIPLLMGRNRNDIYNYQFDSCAKNIVFPKPQYNPFPLFYFPF